VVDTDGTSPLAFHALPGDHHVAVRHRNHLGCMSAAPLTVNETPSTLDFKDPGTSVHGTNARKLIGGAIPVALLWAGDGTFDGILRYTGQDNDRDPLLQAIGGAIPTATVTGYLQEDLNLDGTVKYAGADNDRDMILQNIGGTVPTAIRTEQIPE